MAGVNLATAYVQLVPTTRGIHAQITGELNGVDRDFENAGRSAGNRFSAAAKAGALAGGALVGGIAAIFKTGLGEQSDFLKGQAQLAAGLKSTGGVAHTTVDGMEALASSIQDYSGQTDDSIVGAEQLLLTFTNIRNNGPDKIFDDATKAAADMAAKMGGDASSNAILLGKALNDPVKGVSALTKVGVTFSDKQKATIAALVKTGDTAGAQKVILSELSTEFGGAAKAAGDSLPGQLTKAKRSFEDVSQSVVASLMPALTAGANILTHQVMPVFKAVVGFFTGGSTAAKILGTAIGGLVIALGAAKVVMIATNVVAGVQAVLSGEAAAATALQTAALGAQKVALGISTAAQWLFNASLFGCPLILIVAGIIALVAVVVVIATKTTWFQTIWTVAWGFIKGAALAVFNWIKANWPLILAILTGPIGLAVLAIVRNWDKIKAGFTAVKDWIRTKVGEIVGFITGIPGRIAGVASTMFNSVKTAITTAKTWVSDEVGKIAGFFTGIGGKIATAASGMFDGIKEAFRSAINWIIRGWNGLEFSMPAIDTHIPGVGKVGGFTVGVPDIPELASGGPVVKGMPYVVGDGGRPELFVPDQNGRVLPRVPAGGRGEGVTINQVINNPIRETVSVSGPAGLRRAAYALGRAG